MLKRRVTFQEPLQRITAVSKAPFVLVDAIYAFPEAAKSVAAIGNTAQS